MKTATECKQIAFDAIAREMKDIESAITSAAYKGALRIELSNISDAAKLKLLECGYTVKIVLDMKKENPGSEPHLFSISWDGKKQ